MPKWGWYDGIEAKSCEQRERPDGVGWWEVTDVDPEGTIQRPVKHEGLRPDWRCDVCHISRPDEKISVAHHVHLYPRASRNLPPIRMESNVKFCVDKENCRASARLHDHQALAFNELNQDFIALSEKYEGNLFRWKIMVGAAIVLLIIEVLILTGVFDG